MVPNASDPPHSILGVSRTANLAEIKTAYKRLAMVHHPDRVGGDSDKFKMISDAYQSLRDMNDIPIKMNDIIRISLTLEECYTGTRVSIANNWVTIPPCRNGTIMKVNISGTICTMIVEQRKHPLYSVHGNDIIMPLKISAIDAMVGHELIFTYIDGEEYRQHVKSPIRQGKIIKVLNKGLVSTGNIRGDLYIIVDIYIPSLTENEKADIVAAVKKIP